MTVVKNNRGSGYFTPCVIVLVIAMILSVVLFYASTMTIVQTTRENTEMVARHCGIKTDDTPIADTDGEETVSKWIIPD